MPKSSTTGKQERSPQPTHHPLWRWLAIIFTSLLVVSAIVATIAAIEIRRAAPIMKSRVIKTLESHFNSRVELDDFHVAISNGLEVSGHGLRIYAPPDVLAAGATAPEFTVATFSFRSDVIGLLRHPTHVNTVHVDGLEIRIPPRQVRKAGVDGKPKRRIEISADQIICTNSHILIESSKPGKDPKNFVLQKVVLEDVGRGIPLHYDATLINAIPRGNIQATGTFGPWNPESPGDSNITGTYRFDHADLNPIKGIGGILSSVGSFGGQLNRIVVDGTTQTPDFSIDTANHPMPLSTKFHAIVDGTSGDTYLQPVQARLGSSSFQCSGSVVNIQGKGHTIDLDVDVPRGRLEDFLLLAVKTRPVVLTSTLGMKAKLHIHPGPESVSRKISLKGNFTLTGIHFTNPETQDKLDDLSLRAQGNPEAAHAGAPDVLSHMSGTFSVDKGVMHIPDLAYTLPGVHIDLAGIYSLDGQQFEFAGQVRTQATLSQMVKPGWKSMLLKLADPFFKKDGAGAEIPIKVSGTKSAPKFGFDFGGKEQERLSGRKPPPSKP
jgi:hypothetical protein